MNKQMKEIAEKRSKIVADMHKVVELAEKEDRGLNADERSKWDKMNADVSAYDQRYADAKRSHELTESEKMVSHHEGARGQDVGDDERGDLDGGKQHEKAFRSLIRSMESGMAGLPDEVRKILIEKRAQAVGTDSAGGYLVPEGFGGRVIETMKAFGGIYGGGATVLRTATGNDLPFPTEDDTGNSGALLAENTQDSEQDLTFGVKTLGAYKFTSKIVRVPFELLQDSAFNLEQYLARKFGIRLGRATSPYYAVGTGSAQPEGLMYAATVGKNSASKTAITYAELLALKHSVDPAYRNGAKWVMHDTTLLAAKLLLDGNDRPLFIPDLQAGGLGKIDGDAVVIDQSVDEFGSLKEPVGYGDMSQFIIRDVKEMTMLRLVERYADYHQVGFLMFSRSDSKLMDTKAFKTMHMPT
jgi:HK97 family phage major capsid protein